MTNISQYQKLGTATAAQHRTERKDALDMVAQGTLTIEELIDASTFSPSYQKIRLRQALKAAKIPTAIKEEIYAATGLNPERRIGTLTSNKASNRKAALLNALHQNYHPGEGWPWRSNY